MLATRCKRQVTLLLIVVLTAACAAPAPEVEPADLVLLNGTIVTLDDQTPEAEAVAIRDSRIAALGGRADVEPFIGNDTEVIDLEGQLVIPGFIEGHGHFMGVGNARLILDLRSPKNWDEIVDMVAEAVAAAEPGEPIRGRGWHQDKWDSVPAAAVEGFPVHASLSTISPDNPVVLTHASGHASFVNQKALDLAGIDEQTPDPAGGQILRDASGHATGLLNETAQGLVRSEVLVDASGRGEEITPAIARRMVELASSEVLSKGVTTFTDAGSSFETIDFLKEAADQGQLGVRLWMMIRDSNEALAAKLAEHKVRDHANGMLSVGGIKLSLDGALGSRGAWLLEPYSDLPSSTGLNLIPVDHARETARLAIEHDYQLAVHAIGDRANREVDIYEEAFDTNPEAEDLRWRIEHAQHLHPDDIPRFGELDVIASMQGVHCTSDASWVPDRLGDERAREGAYMWRDLADAGALVVNGTDAPVEDVDPIQSYYASVSRRLADGSVFYPEQRMDRLEALRTYTINAAFAIREEDSRGTLTRGKLADIVVLSRNILEIPEDEIPEAEVVYTILGGEVVYEASSTPPPKG